MTYQEALDYIRRQGINRELLSAGRQPTAVDLGLWDDRKYLNGRRGWRSGRKRKQR